MCVEGAGWAVASQLARTPAGIVETEAECQRVFIEKMEKLDMRRNPRQNPPARFSQKRPCREGDQVATLRRVPDRKK
jgi:hypothetical protein